MYYRRPQRKSIYSYFLPFFVIGIIFIVIFFGWRTISNIFLNNDRNTFNEKVFLSIESGSAKAMTVGKSEWQNAPDKIYLYMGESLKTSSDGRLALTFFDQSSMNFDADTEVFFNSLKKKNEANTIKTELKSGNIWTKAKRIANPDSSFSVVTDLITAGTDGAEFAVTYPGTVYVMDGNVKVEVKENNKSIRSYTLGVGQQFTVNKTDIDSIKKGEIVKTVYAISDTFKATNWYKWNMDKESGSDTSEVSDLDSSTASSASSDTSVASSAVSTSSATTATSSITASPSSAGASGKEVYIGKYSYFTGLDTFTNKSAITVYGMMDSKQVKAVYVNGEKAITSLSAVAGSDSAYDKKWTASSVKLTDGINTVKIEAEDLSGAKMSKSVIVTYDKTPPSTPIITKPVAEDGGTIELTDVFQAIEGTVDKDTYAVVINDYQLQKYVPGTKTFLYYAKTEIGNLKVGSNEYKIYAKDKAGNLSVPYTITLKLDQKVADAAKSKTPATQSGQAGSSSAAGSGTAATSSGGVKITAPNNGESFTTSKTEFEIAGTVPDGTAKVVVNDYALSLFKTGDTTFKYKAYASMKSLTIGQKNTYTVKAYDASSALLGQASITIDVESGESGAPKITMPSSTGTYTTTLDTIVVGGTVGKWVTNVYLNGKAITDYIPGSEKWSAAVTLTSGKNTFTVKAEKSGVSVGTDTIEVTY